MCGCVQIYARGRSQAVDGRLIAALQALHGGKEGAAAYAEAAVGVRCREVPPAPPTGLFFGMLTKKSSRTFQQAVSGSMVFPSGCTCALISLLEVVDRALPDYTGV